VTERKLHLKNVTATFLPYTITFQSRKVNRLLRLVIVVKKGQRNRQSYSSKRINWQIISWPVTWAWWPPPALHISQSLPCKNIKVISSGSGFFQVSVSGSGSRKAKMTHKYRKKLRIFMFWSAGCSPLRAEGFSCTVACASFMEA
jgi:hypothetical protein